MNPEDLSPPVRALLSPFAALYGGAVAIRNRLFDRGVLRAVRLPVPTISVGNLSAGGTGKSPTVAALARRLSARGRRPGVLSRGYGGGRGPNEETREMAAALPGVPIVEDPDRARGGRKLLEQGVDAILLDDGFQHRALARDLDIVLLDATRPFDRDRLIPAGWLREPAASLARADLVVLTRADQVEPEVRERLWAALATIRPFPRVEARHASRGVRDGANGRLDPPESLRGRDVFLVCAVANPSAFEETVRRLGARPTGRRVFRDHHPYSTADLAAIAGARGGAPVLTTGKDWPKLRGRLDAPCLVLEVAVEFTRGEEAVEAGIDRALEGPLRPTSG